MVKKKRATGQGPFKKAEYYFKAAYRAEINAQIRDVDNPRNWTQREIITTVSWMWKHARVEVKGQCEQYRLDKRVDLPPVEATLIPVNPKATDAPFEQVGPTMVGAHKLNTTQFPYMPQQGDDSNAWNMGAHMEGHFDDSYWARHAWLGEPMGMEDDDEGRWHGVRFLGEGGGGRVGLWVKINENNVMIDQMAVKENIHVEHMLAWTSPKLWRDRLPISIAVQERIRSEGRPKSIHGYRGYRLNMTQKRFRIYNDMCKYGDLLRAMRRYSRPWYDRARTPKEARTEDLPDMIPERFIWHVFRALLKANLFLKRGKGRPNSRWKETFHGDLGPQNVFLAQRPLMENDEDSDETDGDDDGDDAANNNGDEDGIKDGNHKGHENGNDNNTDVIDDNNNDESDDDEADDDEIGVDNSEDITGVSSSSFDELPMYPRVLLADWDTAFFDLQSGDDVLNDNPRLYLRNRMPELITNEELLHDLDDRQGRWSRDPPEAFEYYYNFPEHKDSRITSKSSVWGIGCIIWNLLVNLSGDECPCFDDNTRALTNGEEYDGHDLQHMVLTGVEGPYRAAGQYSEIIRTLTRHCLHWHQNDRPTLEQLLILVENYIANPPDDMDRHNNELDLNYDGNNDIFDAGRTWVGDESEESSSD